MEPPARSFTVTFDGRTPVLKSKTKICAAYDPATGGTHPPLFLFTSIWDTGATHTVITKKVVETCGLKPIGITEVKTVGATIRAKTYLINLILRNDVGISKLRVTQAEDLHDADVLIGMDIISHGDFAVTCHDGKTVFSFRFPSVAYIDFVKEANQAREPTRHDKTLPSRNAPCPCGSGKKYKKCCGK